MIETIYINETTRLIVEHDLDAQNPREDFDCFNTGVVTADNYSRFNKVPEVHPDPTGSITEAHSRLSTDLVIRWARTFHGLTLVWDWQYRAYWFVSPEGLAETGCISLDEETDLKIIALDMETYRRWADGEVYGVILEKSAVWKKEGHDDEQVLWESEESIWGCYLDDDYTARDVAAESWNEVTQ